MWPSCGLCDKQRGLASVCLHRLRRFVVQRTLPTRELRSSARRKDPPQMPVVVKAWNPHVPLSEHVNEPTRPLGTLGFDRISRAHQSLHTYSGRSEAHDM